mmetsp:Transcript_9330/g.27585  ORF Transcript_9330/g.27585 Transcript_9330/m.27585 type:complete len:264 (+) Transcript_9330:123-914(+)
MKDGSGAAGLTLPDSVFLGVCRLHGRIPRDCQTCTVLPHVLPDHNRAGNVDVERAQLARLRDLDAGVEQRQQLGIDALLLRAQQEHRARGEAPAVERHAAVRLLDAHERIAPASEFQELRAHLRPRDLLDGEPLLGGHGDGLEGLVLGELRVRHVQRLAVEDLARAAETGQVRDLVHQGRHDDERCARVLPPCRGALVRRLRGGQRVELPLQPRGASSGSRVRAVQRGIRGPGCCVHRSSLTGRCGQDSSLPALRNGGELREI